MINTGMMSTKNTKRLAVRLIREGEGVRYEVYWDQTGNKVGQSEQGLPTIGAGTNLTIPIDDRVVNLMLEIRLEDVIKSVTDAIGFYESVSAPRQAVLLDMAYNMGTAGLIEFSNTLTALRNDNYDGVMMGIYHSDYYHDVGSRAIRNMMIMLTGRMMDKPQAMKKFRNIKGKYGLQMP